MFYKLVSLIEQGRRVKQQAADILNKQSAYTHEKLSPLSLSLLLKLARSNLGQEEENIILAVGQRFAEFLFFLFLLNLNDNVPLTSKYLR